MANLRSIRVDTAAAALPAALLALALAGRPALAADGPEPQTIPMPRPGYETLSANSMAMATRTERCRIFERRFDDAVKTHGNAAKLDEAQTLRIEGGKQCNSDDGSLGIHKLREALQRLGVDSDL